MPPSGLRRSRRLDRQQSHVKRPCWLDICKWWKHCRSQGRSDRLDGRRDCLEQFGLGRRNYSGERYVECWRHSVGHLEHGRSECSWKQQYANRWKIDSRKDTTFVTTSWNILENHNKAYGIGWTTNVTAPMTIHHNIIRNTTQRNPSTDNVLRAHLFNNFMQNISSYGNYARGGTNMVLENSVFDTVKDPHYYDTGSLVVLGNVYRSTTGQKESSGSTYSVFNPHEYYSYTLDATDQLEALLAKCAGPRAELGN